MTPPNPARPSENDPVAALIGVLARAIARRRFQTTASDDQARSPPARTEPDKHRQ